MFRRLRNLLARQTVASPPSVPAGERIYAIGDIHGRMDLFEDLIIQIENDDARRGQADTTVVLLGDLVDRGPESAAVLAVAREWARRRRVEVIMGNHEEMFLASRTDPAALEGFLKFGGIETICSFGVDFKTIMEADLLEVQHLMHASIPRAEFEFIESFKPMVRIGDYLFVHAGIRPDLSIDQQPERECRWIREPFLSHKGNFGAFVIHGHTISGQPDIRANRIGIDTGAYVHGTLTAIGLEGAERWFLQAHDREVSEDTSAAA